MGLLLKLNLSPLMGPMLKTLLRPLLWGLLLGLLYTFKLKSQNRAYEFFYILKMY